MTSAEARIITYISSKKEDIVANNDNFSFNVLPFYFKWSGKEEEINRIEIINDGVRHNNEKSTGKNYQKYQQFAPDTTQTDIWSSGQVSMSFCEPVAKAEIKGQTLIIDGNHWVDMWRGIYLNFFELEWMEETKKGENNYLILRIKERGIANNSKYDAPTIKYLEINFGNNSTKMAEYKANLQVGKKYHFNGSHLENAKILTNKRLDINNSVNDIPEIREFNEEGEIITHPPFPHNDNSTPEKKDNRQSAIKEKILRNLDKICLDPIGWLANTEVIKRKDLESNYYKNNSAWKEIESKIHKVEIEGEEINLTLHSGGINWEDKQEIRKAIIQEIKQNPQDWKIEKSNVYDQPNTPDSYKVLRHKSGRRHWNIGIAYLGESYEQSQKDWAEIEALLNNSASPAKNQKVDWEDEIKKYFREHDIHSITLEGENLIITYNNDKSKKKVEVKSDDLQLQLIKSVVAQQKDHSLSFSKPKQTDNSQSNQNKNHQLSLGLALGAGAVILVGIVVYFARKRNKK